MLASALDEHPQLRVFGEALKFPGQFALSFKSVAGGRIMGRALQLQSAMGAIWDKAHGFVQHRKRRSLWRVAVEMDSQIIFLRRLNLLAQFISATIAQKTKVWAVTPTSTMLSGAKGMKAIFFPDHTEPPRTYSCPATVNINVKSLKNRIRKTPVSTRRCRDFIASRGGESNIIDVTYEDLLSRWDETTARVQEFLGVDQHLIAPRTLRQRTRPLCDIVKNWDEVVQALRGTENEWMLEDGNGKD